MTVLFDGDVRVEYSYVQLDSGVGGWDPDVEARAGQRNGLLGAAQPGLLLVSTGTHTGLVPFRVECHAAAPPLDQGYDQYEEVVEASCDLRGPELGLGAFDWWDVFTVPQGGPHRVRLCVRDYDAGQAQERGEPQPPVADSYLLQLWPAPMAPDEIIRTSSPHAGYWHGVAREHPSAPPLPYGQALAEQRARDEAVELLRSQERDWYLRRWGGRDPSGRLLQVEEHAMALTRERRDLVDTIAALTPDRQRSLAVELARTACAADDGPLDWQPALQALGAGHPLPAPFDDAEAVYARLFTEAGTVVSTATWGWSGSAGPPPRRPIAPGVTADAVVRAAAAADPLEAALRAVDAASWSVPDVDAYFSDIDRAVARGAR